MLMQSIQRLWFAIPKISKFLRVLRVILCVRRGENFFSLNGLKGFHKVHQGTLDEDAFKQW
jgi:hypothetical protein